MEFAEIVFSFPWIITEHFVDISRTFSGKLPESIRKFPGHFPNIFRNFFGTLLDFLRIFCGHFPESSWKFPDISRKVPGHFRTFPGYLSEFSLNLRHIFLAVFIFCVSKRNHPNLLFLMYPSLDSITNNDSSFRGALSRYIHAKLRSKID